MNDIVKKLKATREFLAAKGWDTSRVTIGYYNGEVRVCDDSGAYDFRQGLRGVYRVSVGRPSKVTEWVACLA